MMQSRWLDAIRRDLHVARRPLLRSPAHTAIVVLTLALGIGANTAIFSVIYQVLLAPLPFEGADRLVSLREHDARGEAAGSLVSSGNYAAWVGRSMGFQAFGASIHASYTLTGFGDPQR